MELILIVLWLSFIFGYVTGNIAVIIIVTSKIRVQPKAARYTLKIIAAMLSLTLVNFLSLLYTAYAPTAFDTVAESSTMRLKIVSILSLCWISAVVLTGWI